VPTGATGNKEERKDMATTMNAVTIMLPLVVRTTKGTVLLSEDADVLSDARPVTHYMPKARFVELFGEKEARRIINEAPTTEEAKMGAEPLVLERPVEMVLTVR
jgi:hypothetical protein